VSQIRTKYLGHHSNTLNPRSAGVLWLSGLDGQLQTSGVGGAWGVLRHGVVLGDETDEVVVHRAEPELGSARSCRLCERDMGTRTEKFARTLGRSTTTCIRHGGTQPPAGYCYRHLRACRQGLSNSFPIFSRGGLLEEGREHCAVATVALHAESNPQVDRACRQKSGRPVRLSTGHVPRLGALTRLCTFTSA